MTGRLDDAMDVLREEIAAWGFQQRVEARTNALAESAERITKLEEHIHRLERILNQERLAYPRYFVENVRDRDVR